jgi:hypothetical protein
MRHEDVETRPNRGGLQAERCKLRRPSSVSLPGIGIGTPILVSVFLIFDLARLGLGPDDALTTADLSCNAPALVAGG